MLTELAKMYGPQEVPFDDLLEASSLPNKRKIVEKRKARQEEAQGQQGPQAQLQMRGAAAEVANAEAKVGKTQAETALTSAKAQTEFMKPELEAAQALINGAMTPPPGETGAPPA